MRIPILWKYLLKNYIGVLFLSVFSFIAILLVSRLEEIAQFAALGAKPLYLIRFIFYQIPYVLPIAIPISCLISAMILFQRLSHTYELTALRSSGISLKMIMAPILLAGALLSLGTFYITSEMATTSHLATRKMAHDLFSANPLLLLQNSKIARLKNAFIQMDPIKNGEAAHNLIIAMNNPAGKRLNLCLVKQIEMEGETFHAKNVSLITTSQAKEGRDHLIIENQKIMVSSARQFASLLRKAGWKMANDHLKFSLLRLRAQELKARAHEGGKYLRDWKKCQSEFIRRFSIGFAAFSYTLLGMAFGIDISRNRTKKSTLYVSLLTAASLILFCIGKQMDHLLLLSISCFLIPHIILILFSITCLSRVSKGIE